MHSFRLPQQALWLTMHHGSVSAVPLTTLIPFRGHGKRSGVLSGHSQVKVFVCALGVSFYGFYCSDKDHDQNATYGSKALYQLNYSMSGREVWVGVHGRNAEAGVEAETEGTLLTGLLRYCDNPEPLAREGVASPTVEVGSFILIINQDSAIYRPT